jgi:hypothetical protein
VTGAQSPHQRLKLRKLGVEHRAGGLPPRGDPVSMLVHGVC